MDAVTVLRVALPTSPEQLLLWSHVALLWILVNYGHRLDPLTRSEARAIGGAALRRWRVGVGLRAGFGALLVTGLAGTEPAGIGLGAAFFVGAALLPLVRVGGMRNESAGGWSELRAEWEIAVNVVVLGGTALLVGAGGGGLRVAILALPTSATVISAALLTAGGALFLVRGGTHVVRGVLEKGSTLPGHRSALDDDEPRHGVTIGNIERLLIYLFALTGSHAAIGLVLAAKGVVRAVEWQDRALVEYFLIGTLASAGLAALVGIWIGTVLRLS